MNRRAACPAGCGRTRKAQGRSSACVPQRSVKQTYPTITAGGFKAGLWIVFCGLSAGACAQAYNPPERIMTVRPTREGQTARPLRYQPDGRDFVIENGGEFFNRPLYGGNTAFRADAGDKPEISLYLPGHGGNVRLGIRTAKGFKWLPDADRIVSRYRAGSMVYQIGDGLLEGADLRLTVLALYEEEGILVRAEREGGRQAEWIIAYGGAGGRRGKRGGDIGCENEPVSRFFRFEPESCRGNTVSIHENTFTLQSKVGSMFGAGPQDCSWAAADGTKWDSAAELADSAGKPGDLPVVIGFVPMTAGKPVYFLLQKIEDEQPPADTDFQSLFEQTEQQRRQIAGRILADTPDPFINAAVSALCTAADAIWDEKQGSVMHGAVAWRSRLLGWRGPYANDALGWHDRARRHLTWWAGQQNTKTISNDLMGPDPAANLARSHPAKQTSGDIGGKHYDMNLVYMDALFRHLLWTGDLELAASLWPVMERHMAWERRLFRRTFGPDQLPLYEAYAAIWASDDLQYHGGGVTHTSAYNYYHNRMMAQLAERLSKDPRPYEEEADLILKGMRKHLWLADRGWYGEWKDLLGLQAVHPSAALWTFYHTIDCGAADPMEAWQMSRFVDTQIAHIPIHGPQIPEGLYYTLPTTNWMPYTWSTNNVVMAETAHTALAYWQAGRADKAFSLWKGCLLDSMYMGVCPGNAGMTTYFDMARGEAQRDFGDAVGIGCRAVVEGLFGIAPDVPAGRLTIRPGFPSEWESARLRHPDFTFAYRRSGQTDTYSIRPAFYRPMAVRLEAAARLTQIEKVTVNGRAASWNPVRQAVGCPRIEIAAQDAPQYEIAVTWKGTEPARIEAAAVAARGAFVEAELKGAKISGIEDPQNALRRVRVRGDTLRARAAGTLGHRTVFARAQQGQMTWLRPAAFEVRDPYEIILTGQKPDNCVRFQLRNHTSDPIDTKAAIQVNQQSKEMSLKIPAHGLSEEIVLSAADLPLRPGSNRIRIELGRRKTAEGIVTNWKIRPAGAMTCEPVNLDDVFNDRVTQIFRNEYLSPRSPYCSLAIPKQGIGSWCDFAKTFEVDDSGLRRIAGENQDRFILPHGIVFDTPGAAEAKNIAFTAQWDNYPAEISVPLVGTAWHLYLLMAGSTNSMQSRFDNGEVIVTYEDGSTERLALHNPTTWWPIDQDYFIDDYGFRRPEPIPPRVHLKTGQVHTAFPSEFKGGGGVIEGGAATVLDLPLRPDKELKSLTVRTLANEAVIGLMSATLVR